MASRDLVVRDLNPATWQMIEAIAPTMHLSRLYGVSSPAQAAALMLKGYELGLGLTASFEFIQIVQGKPALSPRGALALVQNSGLLAGLKIEETDDACTVWMKRRGNPDIEYQLTWSQQDSLNAGLVRVGEKGASAHVSYPKNMRKWRCIGFVIDFLFSDVCAGMKRADEFGAELDSAGNVVEGEWSVTNTPAEVSEPSPTLPLMPSLDWLVEHYGADAVMEAAGGSIPATDAEVAAVAERLMKDAG